MADLLKPTQSLNPYQQQGLANANYYLGMQPKDMVKDASFYGNTGSVPYWVYADPQLQSLNDDPEAYQNRVNELTSMGQDAAQQQYLKTMQDSAMNDYNFRLAHPDGDATGFEKFMDKAAPLAVGAFMGAGALGMLGGGTAAAAAPAAATAGAAAPVATTAATGAGAATAGAGGLGGATGALGTAWGALPGAAQSALTSMGVKGGVNVLTGQPLTSGLLQAGLMSGLGSVASGFTGNLVGNGLQNLGIDPAMAKSLIKPVSTALMSTGTGLLRGQNFGTSLLNGIENGTISFAGNGINNLLAEAGLSKPAVDVLGGAGRGAVASAIKGGNPLTGAIGGATQGAVNYGTSLFGSSNAQPTSTGNKMSDPTDYGSFDGQDWLNKISTDYTDPLGITQNDPLHPDNYDPTTYGDVSNSSIPNFLDQYGMLGNDTSNNDSRLPDFLKQSAGGLGSALSQYIASQGQGGGDSSGGSKPSGTPSFINSLLKQLGGIGTSASANPLAAIATAIGAAGTLRNAISGTPNNFGAVSSLFDKGNAQANQTPTNLPQFQAVMARNPAAYTQHYDQNSNPIASTPSSAPASPSDSMDYDSVLKGLYQGALGRAPDAAGEQYWAQQMKNGATPQQVLQQLQQSPEAGSQLVMGGLSGVRA